MLAYSRALLHWRRSQPLLRTGALRFVDAPEPVLHLVRSAETVPAADADLHALFNLSPEPQTLALPAPLRTVGGHPCTGGRLDDTGYSLHLEPYGVFYGTPLS
ncbi:DUF3459 domain-containing protein, partial [Pseudacidovorax intermedius]